MYMCYGKLAGFKGVQDFFLLLNLFPIYRKQIPNLCIEFF